MTKQEEIREGINRIIAVSQSDGGFGYTKESDANFMRQYAYIAEEIVQYLHSQGVVIKVERQLADIGIEFYNENVAKMLKAGYVAVEPLLKKEVSSG